MTKAELIEAMAAKARYLTQGDAWKLVNLIIERMSSSLAAGERIELRGFGSFSVRRRGTREIRDPRTGDLFSIGPRTAVHFKTGKLMAGQVMYTGEAEEPRRGQQRTRG